MRITQLNLFPAKSMQPYTVQQAWVTPQGLHFDREFMLTEPDGTFITARKEVELLRFSVLPIAQGAVFYHQNGAYYEVRYRDFHVQQASEVWGTHFDSWVANAEINQWFSQFLGRAVQLRWIGAQSARRVKRAPDTPLGFADSCPILLTSEQSLAQLQQWSPITLEMARFRANIVIDGELPFAEEQWRSLQLGSVSFEMLKLCSRCVLITRNPQTLELDAKVEPFRTLKKYHTDSEGKPIFGIYLKAQNAGMLQIGTQVQIAA